MDTWDYIKCIFAAYSRYDLFSLFMSNNSDKIIERGEWYS